MDNLRETVSTIFQAGLDAALPEAAVRKALRVRDGQLEIARDEEPGLRSANWSIVRVIAIGKAAIRMATAISESLPDSLFPGPGIVVTNDENRRDLDRFVVHATGHPLPDTRGVKAATAVANFARESKAGELVLVLISGGASALVPAPCPNIDLAAKTETTSILMAAGADIGQLNTVRKHLSVLKGGGLARLTAPADLHALLLSDVIGDDPSTIASGPTVPDPTTFTEAIEITRNLGVFDSLPATVQQHLQRGVEGVVAETPGPEDKIFERTSATLIGGNRMSLEAAYRAAKHTDANATILGDSICGEARQEARTFAEAAVERLRQARDERVTLLAGGETTVKVQGNGLGGRNQEFALAFCMAMEELAPRTPWAFLSGGTDGRDGPTDAAGGVVDENTLVRLRDAGVDPLAALDNNDSYRALEASGDLLMTGGTGTNVADLQVFVSRPVVQ